MRSMALVWLVAALAMAGGVLIGYALPHRPPTMPEEWVDVYDTCYMTHSGDPMGAERRIACIQAADRVIGCAKERP